MAGLRGHHHKPARAWEHFSHVESHRVPAELRDAVDTTNRARAQVTAPAEASACHGLLIREACSADRSPHDIEELLVLDVIRRVQADFHTAAIAQSFQQVIACARPKLIP